MTIEKLKNLIGIGLSGNNVLLLLKVFNFKPEGIFSFSKDLPYNMSYTILVLMRYLKTEKENLLNSLTSNAYDKIFEVKKEIMQSNSIMSNGISDAIKKGSLDYFFRLDRNLTKKEENELVTNLSLCDTRAVYKLEYLFGRKLTSRELNIIISKNLKEINNTKKKSSQVVEILHIFEFLHFFRYILDNNIGKKGVYLLYKKVESLMNTDTRMIELYIMLSILLNKKPSIKKIEESLLSNIKDD